MRHRPPASRKTALAPHGRVVHGVAAGHGGGFAFMDGESEPGKRDEDEASCQKPRTLVTHLRPFRLIDCDILEFSRRPEILRSGPRSGRVWRVQLAER